MSASTLTEQPLHRHIERLLDAFAGAREDHLKLAVVEQGLAQLELRFWLGNEHESAIFCAELERLREHQCKSPQADALQCFAHNLSILGAAPGGLPATPGASGANPNLLAAVNDMRVARGVSPLAQAGSLIEAERLLWQRICRRSNIPRQLKRHFATVSDLILAVRSPDTAPRALPLLAREAMALGKLFRLNAASVLWSSLHDLCAQAHQRQTSILASELEQYCQRQRPPFETARSMHEAWPALQEIAHTLQGFDAGHPLAHLMQAARAQKAVPPGGVRHQAVRELPALASVEVPTSCDTGTLADAIDNLEQQIRAGVLPETSVIGELRVLARQVLERARAAPGELAEQGDTLDRLCELIDLAASGVALASSELRALIDNGNLSLFSPQAVRSDCR